MSVLVAGLVERSRRRDVYLVAGALGLLVFAIVYGPGHVLGNSAYWAMPQSDERMNLIGYRYFLDEAWHWPVFVNHAIDAGHPASVALWDCIPLWALINKAIATAIPPWRSLSAHAYLGLWHALVYALQPCFGVAILRALGHRTWREALVTALFFLAVPTWIFRYSHAALSAHWIELWAIYLYLRTPIGTAPSRELSIAKLAQLVVAALVAPYHLAMSLGVFAASLLRARHPRSLAIWLPVALACAVAACWFAGYFTHEIRVPQWGFDKESANALSWLVPVRSGILGDSRWIANVLATDWQYEGYDYLGLGILGLLALFVPRVRTLRGVIARHPFLFALVIVFSLFALSNHIYVGSHEVASYSIPRVLRWIPQQFRSPGRFVWVPTYVLLAFLLHQAFAAGRRFAVVVALLAVQLVDVRADWALQRVMTSGPQSSVLDAPAWRRLLHAHDAVFVHPTYSCVADRTDTELRRVVSTEIELLASEHALPINGTYNARPTHVCATDADAWPTLSLVSGALYVLLPQATAIAERMQVEGASCGVFDHGRACSSDGEAIAAAVRAGILRPPPPPLELGYGQLLELASTPASYSWSEPEGGGRWTLEPVAGVPIHLDGAPPTGVALKLQATARLCGTRHVEDVDVFVDAALIGTLHFDAATNDPATIRTLAIADPARLGRAFVVQLRPHDIRPGAKLGCDADPRPLGVWISRLWFE